MQRGTGPGAAHKKLVNENNRKRAHCKYTNLSNCYTDGADPESLSEKQTNDTASQILSKWTNDVAINTRKGKAALPGVVAKRRSTV